MSMLEVTGLRKVYASRLSANKVEALKNVNFTVEEGEYVAIMGESGSGKTTLLNILAALDRPTAGTVTLDGQDFARLRESAVSAYRRDHLGFVFQEFNLLDTFTLEDNIFLPLVLAGKPHWEMRSRLLPIAAQLGIADILSKYPYEVSGGQKQRAAVARALITHPRHGRAYVPVRRHQRKRADDSDGHALREGRQPRRAYPVHSRRRGVPPDLPRRRDGRRTVSEDHRRADDACDGR